MNQRIKFVGKLFVLWTCLIFVRLFYWQIIESEKLQATANSQYGSILYLPADRGEILSRDFYPLAKNKTNYLLYINPSTFPLQSRETTELFEILQSTPSARSSIEVAKLKRLVWYPLAHQVATTQKQLITELKIPGLGFEPEVERIHPEGSSSAYLTGFVGKDENGLPQGYFGLEGYYNRLLTGKPGKIIQQVDALNKPIIIGDQNLIPSLAGWDLITAIDRTVQFITSIKLAEGLTKYQAKSGTVSVMDTQTGQILAMVSLPGYDADRFVDYSSNLYKNPIVSDGYEPGSTFKTIIMSSALDAGVITPQTVCSACDGPQLISGAQVRSYNNQYYPGSSMSDIILHSDNVGMVFVSRKLGNEKMLEYIKRFGFGSLTGIDLQEEFSPELRSSSDWRDIDWATASFGQGIAVTPIQMLTAVNAIAGGGLLRKPYLVTAMRSGKLEKPIPIKPPVQIISPSAATTMTQMMVNGVEKGEVRYYRVPGYKIAGKTGTAQVPIEGHYDPDKFIASFIGFAPADKPKFTMLVTLREPKTSPWGSTTAAPLWFSIADSLFRYYHLPPEKH